VEGWVKRSTVDKGRSAAMVDCVGGFLEGSVKASDFCNVTSAVLAVGLSRCEGSRSAWRVCRVSAGVTAFPDGGFAASIVAVAGCAMGDARLVPLGKGGPVSFAAGAGEGAGCLAKVSTLDNGK